MSFSLKLNFIIALLFITNITKAQQNDIKPAFEYPTKEIYDLLVDKKGFIWIASDFGVSRYNGITCENFTSAKQTSLGCTGLIEDKYGRIWFNNFTGQIFYVENDTVHLLESYDHNNESTFPRIGIFNDELVASSDKGLFTLDLRTFRSKYYHGKNTNSLAILTDKVIIHGSKCWYIYDKNKRFKEVSFIGEGNFHNEVHTLNVNSYRDTAYLIVNPSGDLIKLTANTDTIKQVQRIHYASFINTISVSKKERWVNTTQASYLLGTDKVINGHNLSDIVTDNEGNKWLSSLYYGILVNYKKDDFNQTKITSLGNDDLVVSTMRVNDQILLGTQKGALILYDPTLKKILFNIKIGDNSGSINVLAPLNQTEILVACAISTFRFDLASRKLTELATIRAVKQIDNKNYTYVASSSGLFIVPTDGTNVNADTIKQKFGDAFDYDAPTKSYRINKRCRAVCYYPEEKCLLAAFKNGLFRVNQKGLTPFLYNNEQVFAAALCYVGKRLYIGTINNGLLIVDKTGIKQVSVQDGLFSRSVFKIKAISKHLWVAGSGPLQIFDTERGTILQSHEIPDISNAQIFDIEEIGTKVYMATSSGLNDFDLSGKQNIRQLQNFLLSVKVNDQILDLRKKIKLPYNQNNISFNIGIPAYSKSKEIYLKFRLKTSTDSTWQTTEPGERAINLSSLMPGVYNLKVIAVDPRSGMAKSPLDIDITILPPWWNSLGFKIVCWLCVLLVAGYIYTTILLKRLSLKKAFTEQQKLIMIERQRISSEIHDDIGSGIFAIYLFADLASKNTNAASEVIQIKAMITELSDKIKEIIWSTNVENDNLETLIYYTYFQTRKMFEHSNIELDSMIPDDIIDLAISSQSRKNIYLTVKELVHNAIKHSKATKITVKMLTNEETFYIYISDNGIGYDPNKVGKNAMGLENVRSRMKKLGGSIITESINGTSIVIEIPLHQMMVIGFDKKMSHWQMFLSSLLKT